MCSLLFDRRSILAVTSALLVACGPAVPSFPDRPAGQRTPLSAPCNGLDPTRCVLPWPSSTSTVADATSPTGLRVSVPWRSLPVVDSPTSLNRADGFSVATPLAVGFPRPVDRRLDGLKLPPSVRLLVAQAGSAARGESVPLRLKVENDTGSTDSLLLAYPSRPLRYDTDYVAVVLDEVTDDNGVAFEAPNAVRIALGLAAPTTDEERALAAYHAPTRALLRDTGLDAARVLRVWDFTTRSAASVSAPLWAMRDEAYAAVDAGTIVVQVESAELTRNATALDVRGHVEGLPSFVQADGGFDWGADGVPRRQGLHAVPFRALVPAGTGPYPVVVFGHGTGGNVNDTTFDTEIVAAGAAKVNLEWTGWTDQSTVGTLVGFEKVFSGTARTTAGMLQSLADAAAVQATLSGQLGEALGAPTVAGTPNPAAGRRPDLETMVYAGGSLGGTMGYVHALADPSIRYAVLNVPGAAWTHFAPGSELWSTLSLVFRVSTPSEVDRALGIAMTQGDWDLVDGAAWSTVPGHTETMFLEQVSIGDPILPNIGTEFLAASSGAVQVGAVLVPIADVPAVAGASKQTAITQFRVPATETSGLDIHGFAANGTPAGVAAREQISAFITSVWAGAPEIAVPASCASRPSQSCDFSQQ